MKCFKPYGKCKSLPSALASRGAGARPESRDRSGPRAGTACLHFSMDFLGPSLPAAPLGTLLQSPTRHAEHGRREHRHAGTGLLAAAQPSSLPLLQRTVLQIAPTPQVAEHCKTQGRCLLLSPPAGPRGAAPRCPDIPGAGSGQAQSPGAQQQGPWAHRPLHGHHEGCQRNWGIWRQGCGVMQWEEPSQSPPAWQGTQPHGELPTARGSSLTSPTPGSPRSWGRRRKTLLHRPLQPFLGWLGLSFLSLLSFWLPGDSRAVTPDPSSDAHRPAPGSRPLPARWATGQHRGPLRLGWP